MPYKDLERDVGPGDPSEETKHRSKTERGPNWPHRAKRERKVDPETGEVIKSSHKRRKDKERTKEKEKAQEGDAGASRGMADVVPELNRTGSAPDANSRTSLPYPSLNRAYSKEVVHSKEDLGVPSKAAELYTPDATDLGSSPRRRSKSVEDLRKKNNVRRNERPPSPPDTEFSEQKGASAKRKAKSKRDDESDFRPSPLRRPKTSRTKEESTLSSKSRSSKSGSIQSAMFNPVGEKRSSSGSTHSKAKVRTAPGSDSNTASMPYRDHPDSPRSKPTIIETDPSPASVQDPSPKTPTQVSQLPTGTKRPSSPFVQLRPPKVVSDANDSPQPPPPPPPPELPLKAPKVDYLLQHGGLPKPVPRALLSTSGTSPPEQNPMRSYTTIHNEINQIFGPFFDTLDQYETVIDRNGSLAVATGYRSVARRLLERLEGVFARELSPDGCSCIMCRESDGDEARKGLSWGEVLEWVSGRRELPTWPAFDFATLGVKAAEGGLGSTNDSRPGSPVKMDPDISEEFRGHYLQQTKKTKNAVNKWLSSCPQTAAAPPQEVDEDTLSFAIITHLDQHERSLFNALISNSPTPMPVSRAPTPMRKPRTNFMLKTASSIQRLHRLPLPPRDAEIAIYLLKNPDLHNLLATISDIKSSEWEVLTSGRFDGFLWSGADESHSSPITRGPTPSARTTSRNSNTSRTATPFSSSHANFPPSRGPTPVRHPVSNDEETEIAVLAEVEREIYIGMEALEDSFEALHRKAEAVRRALRERGAGLSLSFESRRHPIVMAGTPAPGSGGSGSETGEVNSHRDREGEERDEWEEGDWAMNELAPDDSASNISSSRHRRPKRRTERRTPAPVEEEDED